MLVEANMLSVDNTDITGIAVCNLAQQEPRAVSSATRGIRIRSAVSLGEFWGETPFERLPERHSEDLAWIPQTRLKPSRVRRKLWLCLAPQRSPRVCHVAVGQHSMQLPEGEWMSRSRAAIFVVGTLVFIHGTWMLSLLRLDFWGVQRPAAAYQQKDAHSHSFDVSRSLKCERLQKATHG